MFRRAKGMQEWGLKETQLHMSLQLLRTVLSEHYSYSMQKLLEISRSEKVAVDAARTNRELAQWFASLDQDEATHRAAIKATFQQLDLDVPLLLANGSRNLSFAPEGVERQVWNELGGEEGDADNARVARVLVLSRQVVAKARLAPGTVALPAAVPPRV